MLLGTLAASRDPEVVAAAVSLTQQKDAALADPMGFFTNAIAGCTEQEIEKIIIAACGTNTPMKYELLAKMALKGVYSLLQTKDLQKAGLKNAAVNLFVLLVANAFASDNGAIAWGGEGTSLQAVCSRILKEKCKHAGAVAANAAAAAANAAAGRG